MGEGENKYETLIGNVVFPKEDNESHQQEEMLIPGRFKTLLKADRLPQFGRYNGKKFNKADEREYYDVTFMKTNDMRLTNLCLSRFNS